MHVVSEHLIEIVETMETKNLTIDTAWFNYNTSQYQLKTIIVEHENKQPVNFATPLAFTTYEQLLILCWQHFVIACKLSDTCMVNLHIVSLALTIPTLFSGRCGN